MTVFRGNRHLITIAGKTFWVDSNQEETLINWLEENGFHDRWRRTNHGLSVGRNNYTPDLELSIQLNGKTHRALIESKPNLDAFTPYISGRMRKIAKHYCSEVLLLFTHDTNTWHRVDIKTGNITEFGTPTPGKIPINKLYKPFVIRGRSFYNHTYFKRLDACLGQKALTKFADGLEFGVKVVVGPKKKKRKKSRKPNNNRKR